MIDYLMYCIFKFGALTPVQQEVSISSPMDKRYVYMDSPAMDGLVIELMEVDDDAIADFERCAGEAEMWDGSDPYRLIAL